MTAASLKWSPHCRKEGPRHVFFFFFSHSICDPDLIFYDILNGTIFFCVPTFGCLITRHRSDQPHFICHSRQCPVTGVHQRKQTEADRRNRCSHFGTNSRYRCLYRVLHPLPFSLYLFFIPTTDEWPLHDVTTLIHNKCNFSSLWNANMIKRRVEASYQSAPS